MTGFADEEQIRRATEVLSCETQRRLVEACYRASYLRGIAGAWIFR
jgi:hypothetical protein